MVVYYNEKILANNVKIAGNFISRLIGLMGKKSIDRNEGLLLMNCSSVHCFFMKFTIDVVYLSQDMHVIYKETIHPWKVGKIVKKSSHVLELAEGAARGVSIGDNLVFME